MAADTVEEHLRETLAHHGVSLPAKVTSKESIFSLDKPRQHAMSEYARRSRTKLHELVELVCGQSPTDYRPNKSLLPTTLGQVCGEYKHTDKLVRIAEEGVRVPLSRPITRSTRPLENHGSARERNNILRKNVRQEQDAGRVIVLDMDLLELWPEIVISPYGVVDKAGADPSTSVRTIQNLSFPPGHSVNDATDKDQIPPPEYRPVEAIAQEILRLRELYPDAVIYLLAGDVALAFRHIHLHSGSVFLFGGVIPEDNALVIDLACPFGWTGSPSFYELFGGAISHTHGRTTASSGAAPFFSYHWVDDHVLVSVGTDSEREACERSLRSAMVSILGSTAINEAKFTGWQSSLKILGLLFDTAAMTIAMPETKIAKAKSLVAAAYHTASLSITAYRSLLGSLRHVATCIRAARPFLQCLRKAEHGLQFKKAVPVSASMQLDLLWWWKVLHSPHLNGVPITYFRQLPEPDIIIHMDACDVGLCALDATNKQYLLYKFPPEELALISAFKDGAVNGFEINYRELLSSGFAVRAWAARWQRQTTDRANGCVHVHFKIDNTSAVAWHQRMSSPNARAQVLIRLLSHWEDAYGLRFSASHIAGDLNDIADAGSRSFSSPTHRSFFNLHTRGWTSTPTPPSACCFQEIWQSITASTPLPTPPSPSTGSISSFGDIGRLREVSIRGSATSPLQAK